MYIHKLTLFSIIVIPGRLILCSVHNPNFKPPTINICLCKTSKNVSMCSRLRDTLISSFWFVIMLQINKYIK